MRELFQTIFEDKQVMAAAHFRFQRQLLMNKITKFVDDVLIFQSLSESCIRPK